MNMSNTKQKQREYDDFSDVEDREVEEQVVQDYEEDYETYEENYEEDYEETYEQNQYYEEPKATETFDAWDDAEEEPVVPVKVSPYDSVTKKEEADVFAQFQKMCKLDEDSKRTEQLCSQYDELMAWCEEMKIDYKEIPGTFAQKVEEMRFQKAYAAEQSAKKLAALAAKSAEERKLQEAKERESRRIAGEKALAAVANASAAAGKKRAQEKASGPNAKGKEQGDKTGIGKRQRKAAEKAAEAKKIATKSVQIATKPDIMPPMALIPNANVKSKCKGTAAQPIEVIPEIEEEEDLPLALYTKEQIVVVEPPKKQVEIVKDDGFTLVTSKKGKTVKQLTSSEVTLSMFKFESQTSTPSNSMDAIENARSSGFSILADKTQQKESLSRTRMCNSVGTGKPCLHGNKCRFAHTFEQLQKKNCAFGIGCRYTKKIAYGVYENNPGQYSGKICQCWHQDETDESYAARMGIKMNKAPVQSVKNVTVEVKQVVVTPAEPVKIELKQQVVTPVKLAPWAQPKAEPVAPKRKSRWDEKPSEPVVTPRKSRFSPEQVQVQQPTIIRVPKAMQQSALEMCINKGMTNFQIIVTDA
jgi:hypothetical protein